MGIEYRLLEDIDSAAAVDCISESFYERDLLSVALGIGLDDWKVYAKGQVKRAINDNVSIAAFDDGKIIGALLSYDFLNYDPKDYRIVDSFVPISKFMEDLYSGYDALEKTMHFSYLGVVKDYLSKNIGHAISVRNINLAKRRGFEKIVLEAVPLYTQRVASMLGFRKVNEIFYKDFVYDGKRPFKTIEEAPSCVLMELDLL